MHDYSHTLYQPLRFLHILGAMVFLGALLVGLWWKLGADRTGDLATATGAHKRLRKLDGQLVGPSAFVTFAAGYAMVRFLGGKIGQHTFVIVGLALMTTALAFWYFGMRGTGDALADATALDAEYARRSGVWVACAGLAVLLVVATAGVMVFYART